MSYVYNIKAHPTEYSGVRFRSRLEARWAAFFDLIGWKWEYEPVDLVGWSPDFKVEFDCGHSECAPTHNLLVEIKPFDHIFEFEGHPATQYPFGFKDDCAIPADASACFGLNPNVVEWQMVHGAGGGLENSIQRWTQADVQLCWKIAGNAVQWSGR